MNGQRNAGLHRIQIHIDDAVMQSDLAGLHLFIALGAAVDLKIMLGLSVGGLDGGQTGGQPVSDMDLTYWVTLPSGERLTGSTCRGSLEVFYALHKKYLPYERIQAHRTGSFDFRPGALLFAPHMAQNMGDH